MCLTSEWWIEQFRYWHLNCKIACLNSPYNYDKILKLRKMAMACMHEAIVASDVYLELTTA